MNLHMQTFEQEFKREAKFLRNFSHPHIIKMVHSRMRGGSNGSDDERRPNSGESRKSNNSNGSHGNGSGSSDEQQVNENEFD